MLVGNIAMALNLKVMSTSKVLKVEMNLQIDSSCYWIRYQHLLQRAGNAHGDLFIPKVMAAFYFIKTCN